MREGDKMTNEQFKQLQEILEFCQEGMKELQQKDYYSKKKETEKKQNDFGKFYEEHCKKYGKEL